MDCNAEEKILMIIQGQGSKAKIVLLAAGAVWNVTDSNERANNSH